MTAIVQTFPCQCGEPIFLPHVRCQTCICRQRDAAITRAEAAEASLTALRREQEQIATNLKQWATDVEGCAEGAHAGINATIQEMRNEADRLDAVGAERKHERTEREQQ